MWLAGGPRLWWRGPGAYYRAAAAPARHRKAEDAMTTRQITITSRCAAAVLAGCLLVAGVGRPSPAPRRK